MKGNLKDSIAMDLVVEDSQDAVRYTITLEDIAELLKENRALRKENKSLREKNYRMTYFSKRCFKLLRSHDSSITRRDIWDMKLGDISE